jgi:hypothetical protein
MTSWPALLSFARMPRPQADRRRRTPALTGLLLLLLLPAAWLGGAPAAAAADEPDATADISDADAADFLRRLQSAVTAHNVSAVAALTQFPLTVNGKAGPKSPDEFTQQFDAIFTARVRAAILTQSPGNLFANWHGMMIGRGEVWFSALCDAGGAESRCKNRRILIVSINN